MSVLKTNEILTQLDDVGVLTVTLNRPDRLNALSLTMLEHFPELIRQAARDLSVRVLVLCGAGRGFCSGGDIHAFNEQSQDPIALRHSANPEWNELEARYERLQQMTEATKLLYTMGKPTIAMLRGPVAGAGLSLATACDIRIASGTTRFTSAFARIAASGDLGGSYFLTKIVGSAKAREIYYLSDTVDADEAFRLGLINQLTPDEELENVTLQLARRLAASSAIALRNIKENINAADCQTMEQTLAIEAKNMVRSNLSRDAKEARKTFLKRPSSAT